MESILEELRHNLVPSACSESNENGIQFLRNGDQVYCDQKWTVRLNKIDITKLL